jgi:hypothetical protein
VRFHYISPSSLPSRAANAVHVALQCDALARAGAALTLYAKRTVAEEAALPDALQASYGVDARAWRIVSYHSRITRADSARIAAMALRDLRRGTPPDAILSRNLYAAYALAVLYRRPVLFETHQLETGARGALQRATMTRPWVTTVVISHALVRHLREHHGAAPARPIVLHDAAPAGMCREPSRDRRQALASFGLPRLDAWPLVCGYFGHLYPGRGIDVIQAVAAARPAFLFVVFGGTDADVARHRAANARANLVFAGYVPHTVARKAMAAVDALLMPYQASVSIGVAGHDTAGWMSPMKMFEYLGSGVPIVSSDLPALREVLSDGRNALLVPPDDPAAWAAAIDRLATDAELGARLGQQGHEDYRAHYTWDARGRRLLEAARQL